MPPPSLRAASLPTCCPAPYVPPLHPASHSSPLALPPNPSAAPPGTPDPWFNYRATEYLAKHGWHKFFHWFDYESWYPLGRPVGTTIYPGMQISAVVIWKAIAAAGGSMSLNDVCCYVPAWFGVSATFFLALLTAECSGSLSAGGFAALIMAIVPAHIMRSVGGGYDNESIAMTAMCATFFFWVRSLRVGEPGKVPLNTLVCGVLCGLAYIYMVAAWGGFVFVLNMIGAHAAALALTGRFTSKLHAAYTLFFVIGTAGATRVPPVGMNPFKSMEQLMPLVVFIGFQILEFVNRQRRAKDLTPKQVVALFIKASIPVGAVLFVISAYLYSTGYFGPLTARVRGLFVKHTRTGNPLVDSVAEHQPGSTEAYRQFMHHAFYLAPIGFLRSCLRWTDANSFLLAYALVAYYFASKMSRLVILLGPVAAALGGVALGFFFDFFVVDGIKGITFAALVDAGEEGEGAAAKGKKDKKKKRDEVKKPTQFGKPKGKKKADLLEELSQATDAITSMVEGTTGAVDELVSTKKAFSARFLIGVALIVFSTPLARSFYTYSHMFAEQTSRPQIMFKAQLQNGEWIMVDDYREVSPSPPARARRRRGPARPPRPLPSPAPRLCDETTTVAFQSSEPVTSNRDPFVLTAAPAPAPHLPRLPMQARTPPTTCPPLPLPAPRPPPPLPSPICPPTLPVPFAAAAPLPVIPTVMAPPPAGLPLAARPHAARRARDGVVGLRLPDHGHRPAHVHRRRQHVEPRAHRHARPHPHRARRGGPLPRPPSRRLRARLGRRRRRRPRQVAAPRAHRQLRLPWPLFRPHVLAVRLPGRRAGRGQADTNDGEVAPVQAVPVRTSRRHAERVVLRARVHVQVREAAHLQGAQGLEEVEGLGGKPGEQGLRRARLVVLQRPVPARAAGVRLEAARVQAAGGLQRQGRRALEEVSRGVHAPDEWRRGCAREGRAVGAVSAPSAEVVWTRGATLPLAARGGGGGGVP